MVQEKEKPVQAKTNLLGDEFPFIMLVHALLLYIFFLRQTSESVSSIFGLNYQLPLKSVKVPMTRNFILYFLVDSGI